MGAPVEKNSKRLDENESCLNLLNTIQQKAVKMLAISPMPASLWGTPYPMEKLDKEMRLLWTILTNEVCSFWYCHVQKRKAYNVLKIKYL